MSNTPLASFTASRARFAIDVLCKQGIRHFCVSPGSRSTPLALAIGEHPEAESSIHFDERGLGFYALGLAKSVSSPVVILVTTGTAVANLFPAVMEAHLSRVPLVILTADRPPELRDCGSNQTADQVKIFGSFTRWDIDLALSDPLASHEYIASSLAYAVHCSKTGPVQVNCMIREPFIHFGPLPEIEISSCIYEAKEPLVPLSSFELWANILSQKEKGILLLGSDAIQNEDDLTSVVLLAEKLNWPIFSDIISGGRQIGNHPLHIEHFEFMLKSLPTIQAEAILQIGSRFVCKALTEWIQKHKEISYFLVAEHSFRQDPLHKVLRRMECKTALFCKTLLPFVSNGSLSWVSFWKSGADEIKEVIQTTLTHLETLREPSLFAFLSLKASSFPLYLSSSMPVRDADLLFYPEQGSGLVFCNRGASGIDGNVATAAGIAKGIQRPLIAVFGDLAALHDLSSFALIDQSKTPIFMIIINNQGGGIFSFLPVAGKKELFEPFIATSHSYSFASIAETFSLPYQKVSSWKEWESAWKLAEESQKSCLIEYCTERTENVVHHQNLYQEISTRCSFTKPSEVLL